MRFVALIDAKILHAQTSDGRNHPAILVAMIVNAADLADIPTNRHHFKEIAFVNQVSRVMALCVKKIGRKSLRLNGFLRGEIKHARNRKFSLGNGAKLLYPMVNRQGFHLARLPARGNMTRKTALFSHYSNALRRTAAKKRADERAIINLKCLQNPQKAL